MRLLYHARFWRKFINETAVTWGLAAGFRSANAITLLALTAWHLAYKPLVVIYVERYVLRPDHRWCVGKSTNSTSGSVLFDI